MSLVKWTKKEPWISPPPRQSLVMALWYHPGQAEEPDSTLSMFENLKTVKTRDVTQREFCFFAAAAAAADTSPARTVVF